MFYEAKGVVPVDVDTNYPNIVSMIFPKDENSTHGTNEHVILQVGLMVSLVCLRLFQICLVT